MEVSGGKMAGGGGGGARGRRGLEGAKGTGGEREGGGGAQTKFGFPATREGKPVILEEGDYTDEKREVGKKRKRHEEVALPACSLPVLHVCSFPCWMLDRRLDTSPPLLPPFPHALSSLPPLFLLPSAPPSSRRARPLSNHFLCAMYWASTSRHPSRKASQPPFYTMHRTKLSTSIAQHQPDTIVVDERRTRRT
eukprot:2690955-Rhodomonas_salina.1